MTDRKERVYTSIDEEFKTELRVEAARRDMSMSELIREILAEEFEVDTGNPKTTTAATTAN